MRGLESIPSLKELQKAYGVLQSKKICTERSLALYSQWARFDPRLAEILVSKILSNWKNWNALFIQQELKKQPWPLALALLCEQAQDYGKQNQDDEKIFTHWKQMIFVVFPKPHFEQYFIGLRAIAGKAMLDDAQFSLSSYKKWGYLGREVLINKSNAQHTLDTKKTPTRLKAPQRKMILDKLLLEMTSVKVTDYLQALNFGASRRVAEMDLKAHKDLKPIGYTRSRIYKKR